MTTQQITVDADSAESGSFCVIDDRFCVIDDSFCVLDDRFCVIDDRFCVIDDGFCVIDNTVGEANFLSECW